MAVQNKPQRLSKKERKNICLKRISELSKDYCSIIIFNVDHVSSNQMKKIRVLVRDHGVLIMGKNKIFKKGFEANPEPSKFEKIYPHLFGNVGLFFTNESVKLAKEMLESVSEMAPVKTDMISQCEVIVPKGCTNLSPEKTSFFQALNISTFIQKYMVFIENDVYLLKKGDKVSASAATLMQYLNIRPFRYRVNVLYVFDNGFVYPADVLDVTEEDILGSFKNIVSDMTNLSLAIDYPTVLSVSHFVQNSLADLIALCLETEIPDPLVDQFTSAASQIVEAPVAATSAEVKTEEAPPAEKVEEEEDDEDDGEAFNALFG